MRALGTGSARPVAGALALLGATALLSACGGSGPASSTSRSGSASSLVTTALQNAKSSSWVHEQVDASEPGHRLSMTNDAGTTDGERVLVSDGIHSTTLVVGGSAYIMGDKNAVVHYFQLPTKHPAQLAGKWISIPSTSGAYSSVSTSVTIATALSSVSIIGPLTKGADTTLGGVAVLPIHGFISGPSGKGTVKATIYLTTTGTLLPLELTATNGTATETVTMSRWGEAVTLVAPSSAIPLSTLIG